MLVLRVGVLTAIAIVLFLFCFPSQAGVIARDDKGNSVKLRESACKAHPWLKNFREAEIVYNGKTYAACWVRLGNVVVVIDEAGDVSPVPIDAFEKELEI